MIIYLAQAIDQTDCADTRAVSRSRMMAMTISSRLADWGHTVYRPARAWSTNGAGTDEAKAIDLVNRVALSKADALVAILPAGVASVGVPGEIEQITHRSKPAIVIGDARSVVLDANEYVIRLPDTGNDGAELLANLRTAVDGIEADPEDAEPTVAAQTLVDLVRNTRKAFEPMSRAMQYPQAWNEPATEDRTELRFKTTEATDRFPERVLNRAHEDDAGFDLMTTQDAVLYGQAHQMIPCGVSVELPTGTFGWVVARSSTFGKWGVLVLPGIIDSGYRGEMMVSVFKPKSENEFAKTLIPAGTRLAQLVVMPNLAASMTPVHHQGEFSTSSRGMNGWGSSGH